MRSQWLQWKWNNSLISYLNNSIYHDDNFFSIIQTASWSQGKMSLNGRNWMTGVVSPKILRAWWKLSSNLYYGLVWEESRLESKLCPGSAKNYWNLGFGSNYTEIETLSRVCLCTKVVLSLSMKKKCNFKSPKCEPWPQLLHVQPLSRVCPVRKKSGFGILGQYPVKLWIL